MAEIPAEVLRDREARVVKEVTAPIADVLPRDKVFDPKTKKPLPENLKPHFLLEGRLRREEVFELINRTADILRGEPNLLHLTDPITVCGDIHGQFYDLVKLLEVGGEPGTTQYLFLGDYVDRGCFSCEVCLYLFAYKILFPKSFYMMRGNHECRHLTNYFNFKKECKYKYDLDVYDAFMSCFDCLPLGALLNNRFLCVHGGLSPDILTLGDIEAIHRFREPPPAGPMCDLLWSDPMDDEDEEDMEGQFLHNDLRGCSYVYSYDAACSFLRNNSLLSIIRAHEAQDEGYRLYRKCDTTDFPSVICIFSAPNYCDVYGNKGAIIRFQNNLMNIRQFNACPHPYHLPNFMNAFNWSLPFVAEKVMDMVTTILARCEEGEEEPEETPAVAERSQKIRAKIRMVAKMSRMLKTLREHSETIVELKGLAGGQIPKGLVLMGADAVRTAVSDFMHAKELDSVNEKRPPFGESADAATDGVRRLQPPSGARK